MTDCGHRCCDEREDPHHDHFLSPDDCVSCAARALVTTCNVADIVPDEPECLRVAQWAWQPDPDDHPYYLCNFHGEPLLPVSAQDQP